MLTEKEFAKLLCNLNGDTRNMLDELINDLSNHYDTLSKMMIELNEEINFIEALHDKYGTHTLSELKEKLGIK
jgi:phosphopantetheine adenylyltransferase